MGSGRLALESMNLLNPFRFTTTPGCWRRCNCCRISTRWTSFASLVKFVSFGPWLQAFGSRLKSLQIRPSDGCLNSEIPSLTKYCEKIGPNLESLVIEFGFNGDLKEELVPVQKHWRYCGDGLYPFLACYGKQLKYAALPTTENEQLALESVLRASPNARFIINCSRHWNLY